MTAPRSRARGTAPGCRAPAASVLTLLLTVVASCAMGLVSGAIIGDLTQGRLVPPHLLVARMVRATPGPTAATRRGDATALGQPVVRTTVTPATPTPPESGPVKAASASTPTTAAPYDELSATPANQEVPLPAPRSEPAALEVAGLPANLPSRPATRLIIPALSVDAQVVLIKLQNGTWGIDQLTAEVGHLQGTASPGDTNNVALAGHVTLARGGDGPFKNLAQLKRGDEVWVYVGEEAYRYLIEYVRVVSPDDVQVAFPTTRPVLTLITCANWNRDRRVYDDRVVAVGSLAP